MRLNDAIMQKAVPSAVSSGKIPALTGIRGVASFWVVVFHFYECLCSIGTFPPMPEVPVVRSGYMGVDLFFVLSGFVLSLTYGASLSHLSWQPLRRFVIGRLFRILPLHWAVLAVLAVAVAVAPGQYWGPGPFTVRTLLLSMALVQGWVGLPLAWNNPTWSLSAEWLAYIYFIFAIGLCARIRSAAMAGLLAAAAVTLFILGLFALGSHVLDHAERLGIVRCFCEFTAGMLLWKMCRQRPLSRPASQTCFLAGLLLLLAALTTPWLDVCAVPAFCLLVLSCAAEAPLSQAALGNRAILFLGEISFSVYLLHPVLLNLGVAVARTAPVQGEEFRITAVTAAFFLVFPLSWLTWRGIEIPCQQLSRRLLRRDTPY
ncbi:MAG TPA: acyltransferase [Candidatus Sulfotelmatobacter sp.]|jgi:peptidoglycan/LPS O-acetylase OafA/YrhL|nr:acyltransferase [Candidatus Sulfotelmatobacter sp.]